MKQDPPQTQPGTPSRRNRSTWWPIVLIAAGLLLLIGGFIYDVIFAGIPYQDPTPEMSARYARHANIASTFYWLGAGAFVAGLLAGVIRLLRRCRASRNRAVMILVLTLLGALHVQAQGFLDYERDIGDGYRIFRANSLEVCIAKSDRSVVLDPRDYAQVGPVVEYAMTSELILTKNIGRKPRNRFVGDTFDELDYTKSFCFIIQKSSDKVTGPMSGAEFRDHPLVRSAGEIRWQQPRNPIFGLPLLGIAIALLLVFVAAAFGLFRLVRGGSRRNTNPFPELSVETR